MNRIEMLKKRIEAKRAAAEIVEKAMTPIKAELERLDNKAAEYWNTYSYWLNYNHPVTGVCNRSIADSREQFDSVCRERKELLASIQCA